MPNYGHRYPLYCQNFLYMLYISHPVYSILNLSMDIVIVEHKYFVGKKL